MHAHIFYFSISQKKNLTTLFIREEMKEVGKSMGKYLSYLFNTNHYKILNFYDHTTFKRDYQFKVLMHFQPLFSVTKYRDND